MNELVNSFLGDTAAIPEHRGPGQHGRSCHHDEAVDGHHHRRSRRSLHPWHLPQLRQTLRPDEPTCRSHGYCHHPLGCHLPQAGGLGGSHHQAEK